ncbi:exodeoxyribonuclease VII large subunit [uncultured Thiomicrorhabdus sp.]
MIYLNVPYAQKDQAKSLGARWDPIARKWYIPEELAEKTAAFELWLLEPIVKQETLMNQPLSAGGVEKDNQTMSDFFVQASQIDTHISDIETETLDDEVKTKGQPLSSLMNKIQQAIRQHFTGAQWVVAEVSNLSERRGHLYFELSETDANGRSIANARGMIWQRQATAIKMKFEQETQMPLSAGQKLLMLCEVKFHAQYGLSLEIQEIDGNFSLGELEQKVREIRQKLQQEGVYGLNKQLNLPKDFFNIAVIAPPKAAGLRDFQADAEQLHNLNLCQFSYFYSSFQGAKVESEFAEAIAQVEQQNQLRPFDALVIIRGGGAKLDLHQLNEYSLAKAIAMLDIPVLSGIGHERDNTILDEVAHSCFDTPSKVIHYIWQQILNQANSAKQNWHTIQQSSENVVFGFDKAIEQLWRQVEQYSQQQVHHWRQTTLIPFQQLQQQAIHSLEQAKQNLQWLDEQVIQLSQQKVLIAKQNLSVLDREINQNALANLYLKQQQMKDWMALILNAGPQVQVERGFVIASDKQGATVITKQQANKAMNLNLQFRDGIIDVTVKQEKSKEEDSNHYE